MTSWAGFTKRRWREIIQQIAKCRELLTHSERLSCLLRLYDETDKDGMVAYAIGEEYHGQGQLKQAIKYYEEAERSFPLEKYKHRARRARAMAQRELEERDSFKEPRPPLSKIDLSQFDPKTTLFIVSCTKPKIWDEDPNAPFYVPARYAYRGKSFKEFVRLFTEREMESKGYKWLVLSAKYGYIEPWHPIGNYDVTFNDEKTGPISDETLYSQVMYQKRWRNNTPLRNFRTVICFGSKTYLENICKSFKDTGAQIVDGYTLKEFHKSSEKE